MAKLLFAGPHDGWTPLESVDLEDIQEAFQEHNYQKRPVNQEVFEYLVNTELDIVFQRIRLDPEFKTADGRMWTSITFTSVKGGRFKILFPRHEDGRTTGHVSFYHQAEDTPTAEEIRGTVSAVIYFFKTALREVHWEKFKR